MTSGWQLWTLKTPSRELWKSQSKQSMSANEPRHCLSKNKKHKKRIYIFKKNSYVLFFHDWFCGFEGSF